MSDVSFDEDLLSLKFGRAYWDKMKAQGGERKDDYQQRVYAQAIQSMKILQDHGYDIKSFNSGWQYRVNDKIDIYPRNERWHDLKTQDRGSYSKFQKNLTSFVQMKTGGIKI